MDAFAIPDMMQVFVVDDWCGFEDSFALGNEI